MMSALLVTSALNYVEFTSVMALMCILLSMLLSYYVSSRRPLYYNLFVVEMHTWIARRMVQVLHLGQEYHPPVPWDRLVQRMRARAPRVPGESRMAISDTNIVIQSPNTVIDSPAPARTPDVDLITLWDIEMPPLREGETPDATRDSQYAAAAAIAILARGKAFRDDATLMSRVFQNGRSRPSSESNGFMTRWSRLRNANPPLPPGTVPYVTTDVTYVSPESQDIHHQHTSTLADMTYTPHPTREMMVIEDDVEYDRIDELEPHTERFGNLDNVVVELQRDDDGDENPDDAGEHIALLDGSDDDDDDDDDDTDVEVDDDVQEAQEAEEADEVDDPEEEDDEDDDETIRNSDVAPVDEVRVTTSGPVERNIYAGTTLDFRDRLFADSIPSLASILSDLAVGAVSDLTPPPPPPPRRARRSREERGSNTPGSSQSESSQQAGPAPSSSETQAAPAAPAAESSADASSAPATSGEPVQIRLKFMNDEVKETTTSLSDTLGKFKRENLADVGENVLRLIYRGQLLRDDNKTLAELGLEADSVIHCHISNVPLSTPGVNTLHHNHENPNPRNPNPQPRVRRPFAPVYREPRDLPPRVREIQEDMNEEAARRQAVQDRNVGHVYFLLSTLVPIFSGIGLAFFRPDRLRDVFRPTTLMAISHWVCNLLGENVLFDAMEDQDDDDNNVQTATVVVIFLVATFFIYFPEVFDRVGMSIFLVVFLYFVFVIFMRHRRRQRNHEPDPNLPDDVIDEQIVQETHRLL